MAWVGIDNLPAQRAIEDDDDDRPLGEKIAAGHATEAHHDGGTARRFADWLVRAKILIDDPLETITIPKQPKRRRAPFTDDQVPLILAATRGGQQPERDVTIVAIALCCGLRKDEIRQLNWPDDVELTRKVLWVRDAKTDAGIRCVPITNPAVVAQIDGYVKDWRPSQSSGPLFLNRHGDPFSYDGFSQIFTRIKKRLPANLDFKIHRARNTALTNWRRGGADIELIQLAGHSDIAHMKIYLGALTPEELARVPDAFGRFYGKRAV